MLRASPSSLSKNKGVRKYHKTIATHRHRWAFFLVVFFCFFVFVLTGWFWSTLISGQNAVIQNHSTTGRSAEASRMQLCRITARLPNWQVDCWKSSAPSSTLGQQIHSISSLFTPQRRSTLVSLEESFQIIQNVDCLPTNTAEPVLFPYRYKWESAVRRQHLQVFCDTQLSQTRMHPPSHILCSFLCFALKARLQQRFTCSVDLKIDSSILPASRAKQKYTKLSSDILFADDAAVATSPNRRSSHQHTASLPSLHDFELKWV